MGVIANLGRLTTDGMNGFGDFCRFSGRALAWAPHGLARWKYLRRIFPQFFEIGTRSLGVVMITGAFAGMVLAVQTVMQFRALGMAGRMGTVVNLSVLRELGPVMAGLMLAGRVGGGMTAELGTMRVTEQIDALRAMGADPIRVLVVPRLLACLVLMPILVLYAAFLGIFGGYAMSVHVYGVPAGEYWAHSAEAVRQFDVYYGPIKGVFFGLAIALVGCYKGFRASAGAAGVGRACTEAFVLSAMAILALDFFLGMFLNTLYEIIYGVAAGL